MDQVQVEVVGAEALEGLFESRGDGGGVVRGVPQLAGEEDFGAGDAGGDDALTD